MTRIAATRVVGLVGLGGLGGAVVLSGMAALGMASAGAAPATAATAVVTTVSFTVDMRTNPPRQRTVHLLVQGQMDFVRHTVAAVVTVPSTGPRSSAANAPFIPTGGTMQLHTQWVHDRAYMTVPPSWSGLARGAQTLSLPVSGPMQRTIDTVLAQSAVALTYAKILLNELTAPQTGSPLGSRTIDGVTATGTKVHLSLSQLLKLVPELSPTMTKDTNSMAKESIPVAVWVDQKGRLVEVKLAAAKGSAPLVTGTVQFSDYDVADTVTLPPPGSAVPIPPAMWRSLSESYFF